ncbi:MAG: 30S ribosome-binding factor RbfA [Chloroflexi bacterium]|nr:30S ribosome-binding factor RbfA [Chloroflexota bacterium]MCH8974755.1 30S ribosome-binding factor RbfA [Chloroflexota bacterium]
MSRRTERVETLIHQEISKLVGAALRDPRLRPLVTVARVAVSADLAHATIAVTTLGDDAAQAEALAGLTSAAGFLRRSLAQRLGLRRTPDLTFVADTAVREGDTVLALLDQIRSEEDQESG